MVLRETSFRYSLCVVLTPWVFKSLKRQLIKKIAAFSLLGKNRFLNIKYESSVIAKLSNTLTTLNCILYKIYKCLDSVSYQKLLWVTIRANVRLFGWEGRGRLVIGGAA